MFQVRVQPTSPLYQISIRYKQKQQPNGAVQISHKSTRARILNQYIVSNMMLMKVALTTAASFQGEIWLEHRHGSEQ